MADMKFKYTIQPFQTDAVESVADVFQGQPYSDVLTYRRDLGVSAPAPAQMALALEDELDLSIGYANGAMRLTLDQLLENVQKIQTRNNIPLTENLRAGAVGACSLDVEMETGTGKTYVYIKTMFELNRRYGWTKFVVVVPSIAIREGVKKSFESMREHFKEHYGKIVQSFIYDSGNLQKIDDFSTSADIYAMIINIQAFNRDFSEDKKGNAIINTATEKFGYRKPIDVIAANHPIVILDEPQKMGGDATQKGIQRFQPLFTLNYSATHKQHHTLVYALDAVDAYNLHLVKKIAVQGIDVHNLPGTAGYLYFEGVVKFTNKPPMARIEYEVRKGGSTERVTQNLSRLDDLFVLSNEMPQYRGLRITEIDEEHAMVHFTGDLSLHAGEVVGDVSEKNMRRIQIRQTIEEHFRKEKELYEKGIKTLSLFFIDKVDNYRRYDEDGNELNSEYGDMFEEEYVNVLNRYITLEDTPYIRYLKGIETKKTHTGYFSIDKKGRKVDSSLKRGTDISDDVSAYDLIMKDKERLLSFDNPVRFIFSHSALREGWDNPNVFQLCPLKKEGGSVTQKRQEVGRGMRLCVNQTGDRMDENFLGSRVHEINELTVITADGYKQFVSDLQKGIRADLYDRPKAASPEYFAGRRVVVDGKETKVTDNQANAIYFYLIQNGYIDVDGRVLDSYRHDLEAGTLAPLPDRCKELGDNVHRLVRGIFDENVLKEMIRDASETRIYENPLTENFYKKEFQELWRMINHKYTYTVNFNTDELVLKSVARINKALHVTEQIYTITSGTLQDGLTGEKLEEGQAVVTDKTSTYRVSATAGSTAVYDLVGEIAKGAMITRRTAGSILKKIEQAKFLMYRKNPEDFIRQVSRLITEEKARMIVDHITYHRTDGSYDSSVFTAEKPQEFSRAFRGKKSIQEYVFTDGYAKDGKSVERQFAERLDTESAVCVYAKLPKGFSIPTPVGNYSPDWAIAFNEGYDIKHIYFVAETKGSLSSLDLRPIEQGKIDCADRLYNILSKENITYGQVTTYESLLSVMEGIEKQVE